MYNAINLHKNCDGTYDILIFYPSNTDTEFGIDFLSNKSLKNNVINILDYIKINSKKIKINSVKILAGNILIASISFSAFMNVYGGEVSKYSMAYLYSGTVLEQMSYIARTNGSLNTISPSYFNINLDGSIKVNIQNNDLINYAHTQGLKVIPFLSNHWDRQSGINLLNNADFVSSEIANYILEYNLDGINIDIENVTDKERDLYTDFVAKLRAKLPSSKELSVAVAANPNGWVNGWHGSYDYTNLANSSDYLMIMAYDEHWQGSTPGPVSSISFVENSIKYALSKTSNTKIVLGLPFYGRIWSEDNTFNGNGITLEKVNKLITDYNATVIYDNTQKSPKAIFTINNGDIVNVINGKTLIPGTYTVWYENESSIEAKISLINTYDLKGVSVWSIGQEPTTIWQNYSTWLNKTSILTPPSNTQTPESSTNNIINTGIVNTNILNVRSSPTTSSNILTKLTKNTNVNILGSISGWYSIKLSNGQTGYVSSTYITAKSVTNTTNTTKTGVVNTNVLNVRNLPSTNSKVLTTIKKGTYITILSTANGWHNIKLSNGQTGYVSSTYISEKTVNPLYIATKTGIVNTNVLNLRSTPSTRSKVLTTIKKGTYMNILSTANGWHNVKLSNGQTGYVSSTYITIK